MISKKDLKEKYNQLTRKDKENVGQALLKVNLGVALPADLKEAAAFLKGSEFIAKAGCLNKLIDYIHRDGDAPKTAPKDDSKTEVSIKSMEDSSLKALREYPEDWEKTTQKSFNVKKE